MIIYIYNMVVAQRLFVFLVASLFVTTVYTSCSKTKAGKVPNLDFESYESKEVPFRGLIRMNLVAHDKEGDIVEINMVAHSKNCPEVDPLTYTFSVPKYINPEDGKIDLQVTLRNRSAEPRIYDEFVYQCQQPDSLIFKIWVLDLEGNSSDTIKTPEYLVVNPF